MASNTNNLNLYKKDTVQDGDDTFNIETMLNENWDKIDSFANEVENQLNQVDDIDVTVNNLIQNIGSLGQLDTDTKSNLVAAVNEVYQKLKSHEADNATIKHKADTIALESSNFTSSNVETGMNELFTNVSNGKELIGTAITGVDDSVVIPTEPSFDDLAGAIGGISTGKKWASGTLVSDSSSQFSITGLSFSPNLIIYTQTQYPSTVGFYQRIFDDSGNYYYISNASLGNSSSFNKVVLSSLTIDGNDFLGFYTQSSGREVQWFAYE